MPPPDPEHDATLIERSWHDPEAFAGPSRKGAADAARAEATLAVLQSSGWMCTPVDARTTPALAWAAVVGGQVVGAR